MFEKKDYVIQISKLVKGENHLQLLIDRELFEEFECEDALAIDVKLDMQVIKNERMIEFHFSFAGTMQVECGRCLSPVTLPIEKTSDLYVKFGESYDEPDINEWIIPEGENDIDILSYVYEELRVEIPISPVHKNIGECDKEMIERLEKNNLESQKDKEEIDPRWEKLKGLKIN
ncbi:MAG: DUF177 domain-containing protein [Bacteroidales bacterium]|nr:DUF177 domain-containing protein [Candidatus Scybalousia scybalohippi]MCQ2326461.1 DUF177 domain-containing protein [Bacteroidales bacterium]